MSALSPSKTLELLRFGLCYLAKSLTKRLILFIERHPYLKFLIGPLSSQLLLLHHFPCRRCFYSVFYGITVSLSVYFLWVLTLLDILFSMGIVSLTVCVFLSLLYCFMQLLIIFDYSILNLFVT